MRGWSKCALIKWRAAAFVPNAINIPPRDSWQRITSQKAISESKYYLNKHYWCHPFKNPLICFLRWTVLKCNVSRMEGLISPLRKSWIIITTKNVWKTLTFVINYSNWWIKKIWPWSSWITSLKSHTTGVTKQRMKLNSAFPPSHS